MLKGLLDKIKRNTRQEISTSFTDKAELLILTEKAIPRMKQALKDRGLNVTDIYTDIEDIKLNLLMKTNTNCRIVVVERGLGVFNTTAMRVELTDLLGLCDGVSKKATVFYTDDILKSDNTKITKSHKIEWKHYKSTVDIINSIKDYNEDYIHTEDTDTHYIHPTLEFIGEFVEEKARNNTSFEVDNSLLANTYAGKGEVIQGYDVRY